MAADNLEPTLAKKSLNSLAIMDLSEMLCLFFKSFRVCGSGLERFMIELTVFLILSFCKMNLCS